MQINISSLAEAEAQEPSSQPWQGLGMHQKASARQLAAAEHQPAYCP